MHQDHPGDGEVGAGQFHLLGEDGGVRPLVGPVQHALAGGHGGDAAGRLVAAGEIGRAHVWTLVTNALLVCRLLLEKKTLHPSMSPFCTVSSDPPSLSIAAIISYTI